MAAANNNDAIITYLMRLGASPDVQDAQGRTPAMIAAQFGHVNTLEILLQTSRNLKLKVNHIIFFYHEVLFSEKCLGKFSNSVKIRWCAGKKKYQHIFFFKCAYL